MNVAQLFLHLCSILILSSAFVIRELSPRQTLEPTDIPSECTSACAPLFSQVQTCGSLNVACLCTASVSAAGLACADCIAGVLPSQLEPLQQEVDRDIELCQQEGHPIAPATVIPTGAGSNSVPTIMTAPSPPSPTDTPNSSDSGSGTSNSPSDSTTKSSAFGLSESLQVSVLTCLSMGIVFFLWF